MSNKWVSKFELSGMFYRHGKRISDKTFCFGLLQQNNQSTKWYNIIVHNQYVIQLMEDLDKKGKQCALYIKGNISYDAIKKKNNIIALQIDVMKETNIDLLPNNAVKKVEENGEKND